MKEVLIIGSGIAGMSCAVRCASLGMHAALISPYPSERAQSVMAAGGINAVTKDHEEGDSVACHIEDTLKGGAWLAGKNAVTGLCEHAEDIIRYLESIGTVFSIDANGKPLVPLADSPTKGLISVALPRENRLSLPLSWRQEGMKRKVLSPESCACIFTLR